MSPYRNYAELSGEANSLTTFVRMHIVEGKGNLTFLENANKAHYLKVKLEAQISNGPAQSGQKRCLFESVSSYLKVNLKTNSW